MYRNIVLTLMLSVAIVIAIELGRPRPAPPPLDHRAEKEFAAARAVLERRIPELKLHGVTVGQSLGEIHRVTGVSIEVNWKSLEEVRDRKVDVELHDISLGDALQFLLCLDRYDSSFFPTAQAEFDVIDGRLTIANGSASPPMFPPRAMTLRQYDVRDLLSDSYWGYQPTGSPTTAGADRLNELANLLQALAGMKNYQSATNAGQPSGVASIMPFAGRLFVVQTTCRWRGF
jgi:hypothetical protein